MKIVVAPQEFKGSLSAAEAAEAIARGVMRAAPDARLDIVPMADGGPGTMETVVTALGGRRIEASVRDPLGRPRTAFWGLVEGSTAIIEAAAAAGLALLTPGEHDPRLTSTYGVGELIRSALDAQSTRIIVGLGGSATNDGGAGMAQALGAHLLDETSEELPPGALALARLKRVDISNLDTRLKRCQVLAACDVDNPLLGPRGATAVYGPQKGATPSTVKDIENALGHYADVIEHQLGLNVADVSGDGAAGGLGYGLRAFLGAELVPGFDLLAEISGLRARMIGADLVLTGEGRLDAQTTYGKTVIGVARLAKQCGVPLVVALAGSLGEGWEGVIGRGIDAILCACQGPMTPEESITKAANLLAGTAEQALRIYKGQIKG